MKLNVTAELIGPDKSAAAEFGGSQRAAVHHRTQLHTFAKLLRSISDRIANGNAMQGEFQDEGVKGKFEIKE